MAYADEMAAANRLKSREERFAARNAVRAKYGMEAEKRKRGGVAGAYDRNKAIVQAAAPVLAGLLVPGAGAGIAGAVTGGLARGLDRPGQGGIGLDLGQAARGAVTGYGLGQLGGMAGAKLGAGQAAAAAPAPAAAARPLPEGVTEAGRLASANPAEAREMVARMAGPGGMPALPPAGPSTTTVAPRMPGAVTPPPVSSAPAITPTPMPEPGRLQKVLTGLGNIGSATMRGAKEYAPLIQATATPIASVIGARMEQDIEARKIQLQEEQFRREQEARDRLAQLLMPMFQSQMGRVGTTQPRG